MQTTFNRSAAHAKFYSHCLLALFACAIWMESTTTTATKNELYLQSKSCQWAHMFYTAWALIVMKNNSDFHEHFCIQFQQQLFREHWLPKVKSTYSWAHAYTPEKQMKEIRSQNESNE